MVSQYKVANLAQALLLVTHVRSQEDPKGNIATIHWNDLGSNGRSVA